MSLYVKRCTDCRQVRGRTSFGVICAGERSAVCRWCEERIGKRRVVELAKQEANLSKKLAKIRREIRYFETQRRLVEEERRSA